MRYIGLVVAALLPVSVHAQSGVRSNMYSKQILDHANKMADCILKNNFTGFAGYTYPKLVQQMGGKQKMMELMAKGAADMKQGGFSFRSIKIGQPSAIIDTANLMQCLVPETITMGTPQADLVVNAYVLAISGDKGKTWTFLDVKDRAKLADVRSLLPEISARIASLMP